MRGASLLKRRGSYLSSTLQTRFGREELGSAIMQKYKLTNARVEAGNVPIGLLRRRARGVRDTDYFKLKSRQTSILETHSTIYPEIKLI